MCVPESTAGKELEAFSHLQRCMLVRAGEIECVVERSEKINPKPEHKETPLLDLAS